LLPDYKLISDTAQQIIDVGLAVEQETVNGGEHQKRLTKIPVQEESESQGKKISTGKRNKMSYVKK
jgi:hypothetical protein